MHISPVSRWICSVLLKTTDTPFCLKDPTCDFPISWEELPVHHRADTRRQTATHTHTLAFTPIDAFTFKSVTLRLIANLKQRLQNNFCSSLLFAVYLLGAF